MKQQQLISKKLKTSIFLLSLNFINAQNNLSFSYKVNEIQSYSISEGTLIESLTSYELAGCQSYNKTFYNQSTLVNNKINSHNQLISHQGWVDSWLPDVAKIEINNDVIKTYDSKNQLLHTELKSEPVSEHPIPNYYLSWHKIGTGTYLFNKPGVEELHSLNSNDNSTFTHTNGSLLLINSQTQTKIDYVNSAITKQELSENLVRQQTIDQYMNSTNGEKYLSKRTVHKYSQLASGGWLRSTRVESYYDYTLNEQLISMEFIPNQQIQISNNRLTRYSSEDQTPLIDTKISTLNQFGQVTISGLGHNDSRKYKYAVLGLDGRTLSEGSIRAGDSINVDLSNLSQGHYFLITETDSADSIKRIFKAQ